MLDARPLRFGGGEEEDEVVVPPQTPPEQGQGSMPLPEKAQECIGAQVTREKGGEDEEKGKVEDKQGGNAKKGSGGLSEEDDWFGCSFCENRWFQRMGLLESHYSKEHKGATSYQFELLELKKCVIVLPCIKVIMPEFGEGEELNKRFSKLKLSGGGGGGGGGKGMKNKRKSGKGTGTRQPQPKSSMGKAVRKAIRVTEGGSGSGSSYRRIKEYLISKLGMEADKLHRKLRRVLERFVEMGKLERRFLLGKTLYSLKRSGGGEGHHQKNKMDEENEDKFKMTKVPIPTEEKRRFRDHQLKQLAKSLKPHDLLEHE